MKPAAAVFLTSLLCATISCGQTSARRKVDPSLTYEVVSKNPAKYAGKRVAWTGKKIFNETTHAPSGAVETEYAFMIMSGGGVQIFGVRTNKGPAEPPNTEAAEKLYRAPGDAGIRKVIGTVSKETAAFPNAADRTVLKGPLLTDAVFDAPDAETKK